MAATDHTLNPRAGANPSAAPNRLVRRRAVIGLLAGAPLLAACGGDPLSSDGGGQGSGGSGSGSGGDGGGTVRVGSANFPESEIIGELYAQVLEAKGLTVERKMQIGSREVYLKALEEGSVDVVPEYTGNLALYYDKSFAETDPDKTYDGLTEVLPNPFLAPDTLARAGIFQGVDPEAVAALISEMDTVTFPKGTTIFDEGEPGDRRGAAGTGSRRRGRCRHGNSCARSRTGSRSAGRRRSPRRPRSRTTSTPASSGVAKPAATNRCASPGSPPSSSA